MWRDLVTELTSGATFAEPATDERISGIERALGQPVHPALANLLRETDGIVGDYGLGLVWSVDRIIEDNQAFRSNTDFRRLYMPFEPLLFFADAGNGDQFAVLAPPVDRDDVFVWNHETDGRSWAAANIEMYLRWWLTGKIKV